MAAFFSLNANAAEVVRNEACHDIYLEPLDYTHVSTNLPTRNNNPGNIRHTSRFYFGGDDRNSVYESFTNPSWGYAAMFDLLNRLYSGLTIRQAIEKWAPESDGNNPDKYVAYVEKRTKLNADEYTINVDDRSIILVAEAMSRLEGMKGATDNDVGVGYMLWEFCYK